MTRRRATLAIAIVAAIFGQAAPLQSAYACGVSASGAPAGICDASDSIDEKRAAARDRIGVSYGYTSSILFFSDGLRAPTERHAVMASYEHPAHIFGKRWTLELGLGSLLGGYLLTENGKATFAPGVLVGVSISRVLVESRGVYAHPFVLASLALAGVWSQTSLPESASSVSYVALDGSVALAAGVGLKVGAKNTITPFLAGRLYGGPVFWTHDQKTVIGTDAYKYSLGPGLALAFFRSRLSVSFGASLFGEKSLKSGLSVSF